MRALIQRVSSASVEVEGRIVGQIQRGCLVLLGVLRGDTEADAVALAERVARYRIFEDEQGRMNLSALDLGLDMLVVSQFTLAADGRRGRRPSFDRAEEPQRAAELFEAFCGHLAELGLSCETGVFGALMEVSLVNHGPATFVLDEPRS